jgi:molybdopterin converting factor subunit 1
MCHGASPAAHRGRYNEGMTITVLFFAGLADRIGTRRLELPHIEGDTVESVSARLVADHPALAEFLPSLAFAVDEDYAEEDTPVRDGATVAYIPPVSGGAPCSSA